MTFAAVFLYLLVLFALFWERRSNDRAVSSFRLIIHVNGVRGKTDVCRRLDAALRKNGLRVFTKTTGTHPCYLDTQGREHLIRRWGNANIREQLKIIRKAALEQADVLIIECMAVRPELQGLCQNQIVKSQYTVITNLRYDHLFELGETKEQIARSFCNTVPERGTLFLGDSDCAAIFQQACQQRGSVLAQCAPPDGLSPSQENQYIVDQVCTHLGFRPYHTAHVQDFGAAKTYSFHGNTGQSLDFLNLFSVNDPQSTLLQLKNVDLSRPIVFLFNHRPDRPDRFLLFQRHFFPQFPHETWMIMGRGSQLPARLLRRQGISSVRCGWRAIFDLPERTLIIGIGSIKGPGEALVLELERRSCHE